MANLQPILTDKAPIPAGHYSQAIVHQGVVYIAGQLPIKPGQKEHTLGTIEEQTRQTLANLDAILIASGSSRDQVIRVTIYVSDVSHWPMVNTIYAEFFGNHRPARTVVPVGKLHYGYEIELDAIAAV
jgi:2-iminobutanoate/2-iminopropanoate deaminase